VDKLSVDINTVLKDDLIQSRFTTLGASIVGTPPEATAKFLEAEAKRWAISFVSAG